MKLADVPTPALAVEAARVRPQRRHDGRRPAGRQAAPPVKAFKSTALARRLAGAGHRTFCCATVREMEGMAAAGLGEDLLLANEVLDCARLGAVVTAGTARVTVAVDSDATVEAAAAGGGREVLVDVNVGLPRCGCGPPTPAASPTGPGRSGSRCGVMGYEGHLMREPAEAKAAQVEASMAVLLAAREDTGGDVVSAGGTGTTTTVGHRDPGRVLLPDGHRVPAPRPGLPPGAVPVDHRHIGQPRRLGGARRRAQGAGHGPRGPHRGRRRTCWFVSDEHITFRTRPEHPWPWATGSGCCRPTSTRRWRCTSGWWWWTARTSSTPGRSISGMVS